jgi:hypothetical protein
LSIHSSLHRSTQNPARVFLLLGTDVAKKKKKKKKKEKKIRSTDETRISKTKVVGKRQTLALVSTFLVGLGAFFGERPDKRAATSDSGSSSEGSPRFIFWQQHTTKLHHCKKIKFLKKKKKKKRKREKIFN